MATNTGPGSRTAKDKDKDTEEVEGVTSKGQTTKTDEERAGLANVPDQEESFDFPDVGGEPLEPVVYELPEDWAPDTSEIPGNLMTDKFVVAGEGEDIPVAQMVSASELPPGTAAERAVREHTAAELEFRQKETAEAEKAQAEEEADKEKESKG